MPVQPVTARVEHHLPTRTRFRVPAREEDLDYFLLVRDSLAAHPAVSRIRCDPRTGSVLLLHESIALEELCAYAEAHDCFVVAPPEPVESPIRELRRLYRQFEGRLLRRSGGRFDVDSATATVLLVLAVGAVLRGNIGISATTALWYLLEVIRRPAPAEPAGNAELCGD